MAHHKVKLRVVVVAEPSHLNVRPGDKVSFVSSGAAPIAQFHDPAGVLSRKKFAKGDPPIDVVGVGKFAFDCGVVLENGKKMGWTGGGKKMGLTSSARGGEQQEKPPGGDGESTSPTGRGGGD